MTGSGLVFVEDIGNSCRDTHLSLLHLSFSTILMGLAPVQQVGQTINGTWNVKEGLLNSVVLLLTSAHHHRECTFPDLLESAYLPPNWCWPFPLNNVQIGMALSATCECGAEEQTADREDHLFILLIVALKIIFHRSVLFF